MKVQAVYHWVENGRRHWVAVQGSEVGKEPLVELARGDVEFDADPITAGEQTVAALIFETMARPLRGTND